MTVPLLHIASLDRWEAHLAAGTDYVDPSLDSDGFIHCSTVAQVLIPANAMFAWRDDLVLLVIDADRLNAEVVFEDCYESGHEFPHIYGPVTMAAITDVIDFPPNADGTFALPAAIEAASP